MFLIGSKYREGVMADIRADRSRMRALGLRKWLVNCQTALEFFDACWRRPCIVWLWTTMVGVLLGGAAWVLRMVR